MKKKSKKFLSVTACMAVIFLSFTGFSKSSITYEEMKAAGRPANLLTHYTSIQSTVVYEEDGYTTKSYTDKDMSYVQFDEQDELYIDNELRYIVADDQFLGTIYPHREPIRFSGENNLFYEEEDDYSEEIKSCEEKEGKLYISTELSSEDTKDYVTTSNYAYNEGETMKIDYELDGETLAVLSQKETLIEENGTERPYLTLNVTYNVPRPEAAETLYEHATATENLRTVTIITDPDTDSEETYSVQVPKGDNVSIFAADDYTHLYKDRACTEDLEVTDKNEDITIYTKKE